MEDITTLGDVGLVAKLVDTVFGWWASESGRLEQQKRNRLRAKKEECRRALLDNRFDDLKRLTDELQRMADEA